MGKHQISMKDTISTRTFLNDYLGVKYDLGGYLTHEKMVEYLLQNGIQVPACINMDNITKEDIASGKYLLVRAERKDSKGRYAKSNKRVRVLAYQNPLFLKEIRLRSDIAQKNSSEELRRKRNEYLVKLSLVEDEFGNIIDLEVYNNYSEEITVTSKTNRIKVLKMDDKSMRKRGR